MGVLDPVVPVGDINVLKAMTYNVTAPRFGAKGDGVTDDRPAIQAAMDAVQALPGGGEVYLPPGTYLLNSTATALTWPNNNKPVRIRGAGKYLTTIKLTTNCRTAFSSDGTTGSGTTFSNIEISDMTVDQNTVARSGLQGVIVGLGARFNLSNFAIRRVDLINGGTVKTAFPESRAIDITCLYTGGSAESYNITNVTIDDCVLGRSGGGTNYGVLIQGFLSSGSAPTAQQQIESGSWVTGVFLDSIVLRNLTHDVGATPSGSSYSSANFMVGGNAHGDRVLIQNCHGFNSQDDGIEIDSMYRAHISDCSITDPLNECYYVVNLGGMDDPDRQITRYSNCQARAVNKGVTGFRTDDRGISIGHFILENCSAFSAFSFPSAQAKFAGDFRSLRVKNYTYRNKSTQAIAQTSNGQFVQGGNVFMIWHYGGRTNIDIDGIHAEYDYNFATGAFTGATDHNDIVNLDLQSDETVRIRNVTYEFKVTSTPAVVKANNSAVNLASGQSATPSYTFTAGTASNNLGGWQDAGSVGDITATSSAVTSTANPTVEQRVIAYFSGAFDFGVWGPVSDSIYVVKATPGATISRYKAGAINKRQDASNYLEAYVTDDGTNSYLCVDKVVAGTRTSLLGAIVGGAGTVTAISTPSAYQSDRGIQLASRIASSTAFWVRCKVQGNTVTGDYFTSVSGTGSLTGTPTTTVSATLTGSDITTLGVPVLGRVGYSWVPMEATATINALTLLRMGVFRGLISNIKALRYVGATVSGSTIRTVDFGSMTGNSHRIDSSLVIENCDFSVLAGAPTINDVKAPDSTLGQKVLRRNIVTPSGAANAPAMGAITVTASPFVYQNTDGFAEQVRVNGGTVSDVSMSWDGTTYTSVGTATGVTAWLNPGDYVKVTYSSAPTMSKVPMR